MKRLGSSDSLSALMSTDELNQESDPIYSREFRTMLEGLDEEGCVEESGHVSEKKRRLTVDQVKALEKSFEIENKLEPERKVKLAKEIGLQPRQVAVWFQNRRARYKTKQLERDYGILKANFDNLKQNYDTLQSDNQSLLKQIQELSRSKQNGDVKNERRVCVKEEAVSDTEQKKSLETPSNSLTKCEKSATEHDFQENVSSFLDFKDGSSYSTDSSAILNEENNSPNQFLEIQKGSSSVVGDESKAAAAAAATNASFIGDSHDKLQPQFVKVEEYNFFGEDHDQSCSSLFSDEQAPTLHWYCYDQWN